MSLRKTKIVIKKRFYPRLTFASYENCVHIFCLQMRFFHRPTQVGPNEILTHLRMCRVIKGIIKILLHCRVSDNKPTSFLYSAMKIYPRTNYNLRGCKLSDVALLALAQVILSCDLSFCCFRINVFELKKKRKIVISRCVCA